MYVKNVRRHLVITGANRDIKRSANRWKANRWKANRWNAQNARRHLHRKREARSINKNALEENIDAQNATRCSADKIIWTSTRKT